MQQAAFGPAAGPLREPRRPVAAPRTFVKIVIAAGLAAALVRTGQAAETPSSPPKDGVYEAEFAKRFPVVAGAHHVADWPLYAALVAGDIVGYAAKIDPALASRFERTAGKPYQSQQLAEDIRGNQGLRASFDDHRRRLASMVLYSDGAVGLQACQHPIVYVDNEFRLVLGQVPRGDEPLAHATVAPGCPQSLEPGFQLTAGRSSRFKCWTTEGANLCGWRLPDMPAALKQVIETEYPKVIKVRWSWRGLGPVTRVRSTEYNGTLLPQSTSVALTVPGNLALEFIDDGGRVRWTTPATSASAPPAARRAR